MEKPTIEKILVEKSFIKKLGRILLVLLGYLIANIIGMGFVPASGPGCFRIMYVVMLIYAAGVIIFGSHINRVIAIVFSIFFIQGYVSQVEKRLEFGNRIYAREYAKIWEQTYDILYDLKDQVRAYHQVNGFLPASLSDLPIGTSTTDHLQDFWKRPIQYKVEADRVTLLSFGKDGVSGGDGPNRDISITFTVDRS